MIDRRTEHRARGPRRWRGAALLFLVVAVWIGGSALPAASASASSTLKVSATHTVRQTSTASKPSKGGNDGTVTIQFTVPDPPIPT
jgi:hypothetical protein